MCGFAGFVRFRGGEKPAPARRAILERMGAQLAARGPDEESFYDDGLLALVFRRLSIVDVAGGSQPLWNESRTVLAVANGEIYNHKDLRGQLAGRHAFQSQSDCEVIPHLYEEHGTDLVAHLNGMYALAVWDREREELLLARDRLGIKPLYYAPLPDGLLFGSELKALLTHPECPAEICWPDIDWSYLGQDESYTAANYRRIPSFVNGVTVLPGGRWLRFNRLLRIAERSYWSLEPWLAAAAGAPSQPPVAYVDRFADLFEESVNLQLMSDVGVGAFLSGGLDSSAIVAVGARKLRDLHCFAVCEATTIATGDMERAAVLAGRLGVPLSPVVYRHEEFAAQLEFSLELLEYYVWMIDAPRFAPEFFFKHELHRYVRSQYPRIKVILLGQGADEFGGGYSRSYSSPRESWGQYLADSLAPHHRTLWSADRQIPGEVREYLSPGWLGRGASAPFQEEMRRRIWSLQSHNLWNEDRVSASQGIEARVPFLDHRIVELFASVPVELHERLFFNKSIIREAARRWLPETHYAAPKVLFWQANDTSSVHRLMASCLHRAYPAFRETYQDSNAMFDTAKLDGLFTQSQQPDEDGFRASRTLLACATLAIFAHQCERLNRGETVACRPGASPLFERAFPYADAATG